jgi:RNA polymerase sigma-70 factor (ECF subfamily)
MFRASDRGMGPSRTHSAKVVPLRPGGEPTDADLVTSARRGQPWAREALFRRHVARVVGLAYRLAPEEDPEDVAQEAFLKVLTRLDTLADPAAFGGWVAAVTVSLVKMRLRKRRWLRRLGLSRAEAFDPDTLVSRDAPEDVRLRVRDLYRAAARLTEEQRTALVLQRVEGLELVEIAQQMGLSVATVKRRVAAADEVLSEVQQHGD